MHPIDSKLPAVGTTIFTVMSSLALEHKAINLSQGFPDFSMDPGLIGEVHRAMTDGANQYTHMNGYPLLRERIAEKVSGCYGAAVDPQTEITVTPGATYAIYTALTCVLRPGDEVIAFEPAYDSYIPNIVVNGATPVLVPLSFPDYSIDWDRVKAALTPRTRMILLNTPHNPTGTVWKESDFRALEALVEGTDILIMSDEVYEHITFDGYRHPSILGFPALRERAFACFSFGKAYHCTGWKIGYCIAPPAFTTEFRKVHQFNCFSTNTPAQVGLANYLEKTEAYLDLPAFYQRKRDFFLERMRDSRFRWLDSKGSYFVLGSYGHFSQEKDTDFAIRLTREYGVAVIPVSVFYQDGRDDKVVRFCFAKKESTLQEAAHRLISV
ncbi:MAG TPA: methionine aminotransferase [Dinghuibacter sp.]|uniref:methionine aminotransferase n=1 Tax=Dinghuibacter sp. TaxID=2024697 RepID=UPI002CFCCBD4|nr:methionine aminotransferase [Dinghuibacter sp.]HTJ11697.1 methionine aminotransferase [Dinghuibacter sp.]